MTTVQLLYMDGSTIRTNPPSPSIIHFQHYLSIERKRERKLAVYMTLRATLQQRVYPTDTCSPKSAKRCGVVHWMCVLSVCAALAPNISTHDTVSLCFGFLRWSPVESVLYLRCWCPSAFSRSGFWVLPGHLDYRFSCTRQSTCYLDSTSLVYIFVHNSGCVVFFRRETGSSRGACGSPNRSTYR